MENDILSWVHDNVPIYSATLEKMLEDAFINGYKKALEDMESDGKRFDWTPVSDHNPEIDMSSPHGDYYFVRYEGGGYDVARFCNFNIFWTDHFSREPWWQCAQYCKVEAWMPIKEYKCEEETKRPED